MAPPDTWVPRFSMTTFTNGSGSLDFLSVVLALETACAHLGVQCQHTKYGQGDGGE